MQAIEIHILSMYCVRLTHDSMAKHACTGFYTYFNKKKQEHGEIAVDGYSNLMRPLHFLNLCFLRSCHTIFCTLFIFTFALSDVLKDKLVFPKGDEGISVSQRHGSPPAFQTQHSNLKVSQSIVWIEQHRQEKGESAASDHGKCGAAQT